ncbi:GNAT family N-acetyltransferase [Trinickia dinghuensis]|nr:GNAT family N-acetyltransferase [Trinickia dinghuensis]
MEGFRPPAFIETDAMTFRPFVADDAPALYETMLGDEKQTEWLSLLRHRSVGDSLRYIDRKQREWAAGTGFTWALADRASGTVVASIELHAGPPRAELGVITSRFATSRQRRAGLAALLKLIRWLLAQPQLCRVHAYCAPESPAASTMRRLGFALEGRLTNWLWLPNTAAGVGDALLFAICRPASAMSAEQDGTETVMQAERRRRYDRGAREAHAARLERLGGYAPTPALPLP